MANFFRLDFENPGPVVLYDVVIKRKTAKGWTDFAKEGDKDENLCSFWEAARALQVHNRVLYDGRSLAYSSEPIGRDEPGDIVTHECSDKRTIVELRLTQPLELPSVWTKHREDDALMRLLNPLDVAVRVSAAHLAFVCLPCEPFSSPVS